MELKLYYDVFSSYSQKVRLVLEEKKIPYEHVVVKLMKREHETPWYLKNINPKGLVPVIKHGEFVLPESDDIVRYLDSKFGGKPIYPAEDTNEGKQIQHFLDLYSKINMFSLTFGTQVYPELTEDSRMPNFMSKAMAAKTVQDHPTKGLEEKLKKNPDLQTELENKMSVLVEKNKDAKDLDRVKMHIENAKIFFNEIEQLLKKREEEHHDEGFLCNDRFNYADAHLAVLLVRLRFVGLSKCLWGDGKHPLVTKYEERLLQRASVQEVCVKGHSEGSRMPSPESKK